jgi:arabinogalactan oligomer/maltooligosaccharide transport system permease protein
MKNIETKNAIGTDKKIRKTGLGARASRTISNTLIYITLICITIIWLFPFVGIVFESFRVESTYQVNYLVPKEFGFDNYVRLFTETSFLRWFGNTAFMGVATAVFQTFFVLSMSYTLSRLRFKGRKGLMNMMLILGMFPGFLTMILIYKVFADLGLTKDMAPIGLIIVYCASSGMGYYVSKGFFDTISKSLDEAARVDGATRWQVFYKVIMPLSKPIVIYTVLMGFMAPWGDFMLANYMIHQDSAGMNVAVGMFQWLSRTNINANYTMFCAAGVVVAVPVTAVFLALQKYYVEGVTGGAVKG